MCFRNCYAMCTQKAPNNYADQLYNRYGNIYESYLKEKVLPAIQAKQGESPMLQEFAKRWKNHKLLVRQMWKLFVYLVIPPSSIFPLREHAHAIVGIRSLCNCWVALCGEKGAQDA